MGDAREDLIIESVVMTARIQAAHRLSRKPNREELNAAIDDEVNASVLRRQISPDRRDAISEAAKNFAASDLKTYKDYRDYQNYLAGKSVLHAITARDRANRAREAEAKAFYKELDDEAGKNAGGRRRSSKRRAKTVRRRRSRHRLPTLRRRRRPF